MPPRGIEQLRLFVVEEYLMIPYGCYDYSTKQSNIRYCVNDIFVLDYGYIIDFEQSMQ